MVQAPEGYRHREPCPVIGFSTGEVFLSVNQSTEPPGTKYGACDPHILQFSAREPKNSGVTVRPVWDDGAAFTDHSYRGVAADGKNGEILLLNIHARSGDQYWSFRSSDGDWVNNGIIHFPIRSCYPQVALRDRRAGVLAIGDIVEPIDEWRQYKFDKTGSGWDYVFRRLFYAYTPDVSKSSFAEPVEIDDLEATSGHIRNLDLWIDDRGMSHILYLKRSVQSALMRDKFFPDVPLTSSLEYVVMDGGEVAKRVTLLKGGEGASGEVPGNARFQVTGDGRLLVIYRCSGSDADGNSVNDMRLMQILPEMDKKPVKIPLRENFGVFFNATERGGSPPADVIDLFGSGRNNVLRYARVRLQ